MKKTFALMLAMMMLLGLTCTASAYDEEITFQGIPWNMDIGKALKQLYKQDFFTAYLNDWLDYPDYWAEAGKGEGVLIFRDGQNGISLKQSDSNGITQIEMDSPDCFEKKIAGYQIEIIDFICKYDGKNTELVCVQIQLQKVKDIDMYADLSAKITKVYGESEQIDSNDEKGEVWRGAEDTAVCLIRTSGNQCLLYYGVAVDEATLDAGAPDSAPVFDTNDTSGL